MKYISFFFIVFSLIFISCSGQPDPDTALIETIENNLLPAVVIEGQESAGMNIYARMEFYKVPGLSIAFLNGGKIVWAKGYGFTDAASTRPVDDLTLFQAASIS